MTGEAAEIAREEVADAFSKLGIDILDQESLNQARTDLVWLRALRRARDGARRHALKTIITVIILGACAALAEAWKGQIPKL